MHALPIRGSGNEDEQANHRVLDGANYGEFPRAICSFVDRCTMATPALNSRVQYLATEYGVFWQFWPQFEQTHGEHRLVGFEVELIGSHTSDLNHIDPACPMCRTVRAALLSIANLVPADLTVRVNSLTYNIDSHSGEILCLPALGNRAAVWVSIYLSWTRSNGQSFETDLLTEVRTLLNKWGIHQR
jgi:hypothetical protein